MTWSLVRSRLKPAIRESEIMSRNKLISIWILEGQAPCFVPRGLRNDPGETCTSSFDSEGSGLSASGLRRSHAKDADKS
jgi:hypothetical protein